MKNLTKRDQQAIETRLNIIKSSMELFKDTDYNSVTIKDISEKAEVSVGAIYHHFNSKEDIINSVYAELDYLLDEVYEKDTDKGAVENIFELISYQVNFVEKNGLNIAKQVFTNQMFNKHKSIIDKSRIFYQLVLKEATRGLEEKDINAQLSPEDLTDMILRLSRGIIYDWCLHEGEYSLSECVRNDLSVMLNHFTRCSVI